ncbi:hypothetical protein A6A25_40575 [Saccharothrix sp. CB00851]|nr:hypothetical protein A6A25_40575 [Saccharothrix sp. CB00851]
MPVAAAAVLVLGPQAGADPRQDPVGSMYGQACGYGVGVFGTTPFAPVVGVACTPPQAVGAPAEAVPHELMPEEPMPEEAMPEEVMPAE